MQFTKDLFFLIASTFNVDYESAKYFCRTILVWKLYTFEVANINIRGHPRDARLPALLMGLFCSTRHDPKTSLIVLISRKRYYNKITMIGIYASQFIGATR